jgi:pyridoxine/pyridoxamine 5'-phosphate oxidase
MYDIVITVLTIAAFIAGYVVGLVCLAYWNNGPQREHERMDKWLRQPHPDHNPNHKE